MLVNATNALHVHIQTQVLPNEIDLLYSNLDYSRIRDQNYISKNVLKSWNRRAYAKKDENNKVKKDE